MAATVFVPKIKNLSKIALPLEFYPRVVRPTGIYTVFEPEIIPHAELAVRAETSLADGLTEGGFYIAFPRKSSQWKQLPDGSWQFQGGDIHLFLELMIYISERYSTEPFWDDLYQIVLTHELKHWAAYTNIVSSKLPDALRADADMQRLVLPQPAGAFPVISDKVYQEWFVAADPVTTMTRFETLAGNYWTKLQTEADRLIDSATEYRRYADNLDALKTGHPEKVIWPK